MGVTSAWRIRPTGCEFVSPALQVALGKTGYASPRPQPTLFINVASCIWISTSICKTMTHIVVSYINYNKLKEMHNFLFNKKKEGGRNLWIAEIKWALENTALHSDNLHGLLLHKKLISADIIWKYPAPILIYLHYEMLLTMYFSVSQFCLLCHWCWHWHVLPQTLILFFFSLLQLSWEVLSCSRVCGVAKDNHSQPISHYKNC